jgi:tetratricopeptide (TPR) repeat protein
MDSPTMGVSHVNFFSTCGLAASITLMVFVFSSSPANMAFGFQSKGGTQQTTSSPSTPAQFRPLYLSGKVLLDDGSPPPEPATVELRCQSFRQPEQKTNKDGAFNFAVGGDRSRELPDSQRTMPGQAVGASGSDRSFVSLTGCELEASLPGYMSSKIYLGRRSVFESPDVGTIVLHKLSTGGEGTLISASTAAAPADAKKAYDQAEKELAQQKPNQGKAIKDLQKAVQAYPQFAAAWNLLGQTRLASNDADGAREAFTKAMEADPKFVPPCLSLALIDLKQQKPQDAVQLTSRVLKMAPGLPEALYYNAMANMYTGDQDAAEKSAKALIDGGAAPKYPRTYFIMGNILAQKGDVAQAAEQFRHYLEAEPASSAAAAVRKQLAEWQASGLVK